MRSINKKQRILLCMAPIICSSMLLLIPLLTNIIGKTAGYIVGVCIYWFIFCIPVSLYSGNRCSEVLEIYYQKSDLKITERNILYIIGFILCFATFFVVFKEYALTAELQVLTLSLLFALINGTVEEMFWRGVFNKVFKNNIFLAYIYPTVFFGVYHIALYFSKGIEYQGGFIALVGGSFFMGSLWGWVAYKTKSIKVVTTAHIITNFFAFTGLIYENWFV